MTTLAAYVGLLDIAAETVVDGLGQTPGAFIDLLRGGNMGKMLVRL
jgi:NADPH-dependent curcumin reductase CurA